MIKRNKVKRKGRILTWIGVVEGYRPAFGAPPKQRTIKSFGYLEEQEDPAAFMAMVEEFNANYKKDKVAMKIVVNETDKMYCFENRRQNWGYKYLESVYDVLGIDRFIEGYLNRKKFRGNYDVARVFKFLVIMRMLNPDSKRASCQLKDGFYGMDTAFTLQNVYRSLGVFSDFEIEIQQYLNDSVKEIFGRDLSHAFYDVTNCYFEIDFPSSEDDLRKRGISKEHRMNPIVAMGLFIDKNGLPVSMSVFPGNTLDTVTLQPTMGDIKKSYGLGRLVVVADKGLNSSKNIDMLINAGDGFVFSQVIKGKKGQRYHEHLFGADNADNWVKNKDGTYKYKLFDEEYSATNANGKKEIRTRRVLLYWDVSLANMAKRKREEKLEKAARSVKNNAYAIKRGIVEYIKEDIFDKETGELFENTSKLRSIDFEKAANDERFDGYYCIITSELDYGEKKIREVYGGLWKVEQSFRILKSDLYARPVFVYKNEHIRAHFLICFVSLLIIRIIQHRMGKGALSAERIARALNAATCRLLKGGIIQLDDVGGAIAFSKTTNKHGDIVDTLEYSNEDEIALDFKRLQETFGSNIDNVYIKQEVFNQILKKIL
jgi:transposase